MRPRKANEAMKNDHRVTLRKTLCAMIPELLIHTPFALQVTTDEMQPAEVDIQALIDALQDVQADLDIR